jgi:opacity protein-like surface antigen
MNCLSTKMRLLAISLIIVTSLGFWGAKQPALAKIDATGLTGNNGFLTGPDRVFWITTFAWSAVSLAAIAYYAYKNSPAQRAKGYPEELGPGEWYLALYTGLSYLPSADWKFANNFPPTLSQVTGKPIGDAGQYAGRTAKNITYAPGILGGIKFGRYLDAYPWLGWEMETSFSRNRIRGDQGRISPPSPVGPSNLVGGSDWFMIWALQTNLLARYGFLKDKEVTFGRLQPYVGIGPGFEVIYGRWDSAKNFAIETMAGVRYLFTPEIALFCEYKFSYQFSVEYQDFIAAKYGYGGMLTFDVPHHRFVIGVSYHFKNLYGN